MIYSLLDTNVLIQFLRNRDPAIVRRISAALPGEMSLCSVVLAELYYGSFRSGTANVAKNLADLALFLPRFGSLSFDDRAALRFGELRADLASRGKPIGPYDLQIAAIALVHGLTLVTHNTREFSTIPGLSLEDWQTVP